MPSKLLIIKDNRDHISTIVHALANVWSIHMGKENLRVFGIYDYDEFDAAFSCDFVLFLLNSETLFFENQVPKWLCKLGYNDRPTNNKFKYLVVREFRPSSEQIHVADRTASFWTENETKQKPNERNTDVTHVLNVNDIGRVIQWWPRVIQHIFKTRKAMCKVHVETDENSLFGGSEVKRKVERTKEDIQDFLAKFNALAEASDDSKSHQLFIIGDPSKFYDTHKHLRQEKINGSKIMLIIVGENKHHHELPKISTNHMFLSNMVGDVLQIMVDLGIVGERKTIKKTLTVNQVKDPIKVEVNKTALKVTWSFKSQDVVLSNAGYVSVQVKNRNNGRWEELELKEAYGMTDEINIPNRKIDDEFQVMFEDAKTGSLSTPVYFKYPVGNQCKSVINRILCCLCILIMLITVLEGYIIIVVLFLFGMSFYCLLALCVTDWYIFGWTIGFAFSFKVIVFIVLLMVQINIGTNVIGPIVAIVVHVVLSLLSCIYLILVKDFPSSSICFRNRSILANLCLLLEAQIRGLA